MQLNGVSRIQRVATTLNRTFRRKFKNSKPKKDILHWSSSIFHWRFRFRSKLYAFLFAHCQRRWLRFQSNRSFFARSNDQRFAYAIQRTEKGSSRVKAVAGWRCILESKEVFQIRCTNKPFAFTADGWQFFDIDNRERLEILITSRSKSVRIDDRRSMTRAAISGLYL